MRLPVPPENSPCAAFVLAGGKSSRLGTDKAFLKFNDVTLLDHAIKTLRQVTPHIAIIGDPQKFNTHDRVLPDIYRNCGPLGGIHAALSQTSAELNLVIAVDLPFVTSDLCDFLVAKAASCNAIVTVPRTNSGLQPLCAVYRRAFVSEADSALRAGKYKIDALFSQVSVRVIDEEELGGAGFSERVFFNINTSDDLRAAQRE
jgi:molybdopterin-guanine dinucleotide biosynthesis protein A